MNPHGDKTMEIRMTLHEDVFSALRRSPQEFACEMRLAAAVHWYKRGEISQEKAAQVGDSIGRTSSSH